MDMRVTLPARSIGACYETTATEYASLAEHRRQVFVLIGQFRQALARPRGRRDALRALKALVVYSDAYFASVESLLDKISGAGAAPHRSDHRRILDELRCTLERCSASAAESETADLAHALDTLVMHEAAIRMRASESRPALR